MRIKKPKLTFDYGYVVIDNETKKFTHCTSKGEVADTLNICRNTLDSLIATQGFPIVNSQKTHTVYQLT